MTRIRPVPFVILLTGLLALSSASAGAATSVAFLDIDRSPLGAVLESKLLANSALAWIEIADLGSVLKEQDLQAAFSPEALQRRVSIGLLAKTDLLVLLRSVAPNPAEKGPNQPPPAKRLDVVICETRYGMRLGAHSVPEGKNLEGQATQINQLVDRAISKFSRQRTEICTVSPFINSNELLRTDYLRQAYAETMKQMLLEYDHLALVEPAEAEALANEFEQAGDTDKQRRRLPLVFAGEYRHTGAGEPRKVDVRLQLMRGDQRLGIIEEQLRPDAVADFLRRGVIGLLAKTVAGTSPKQNVPIAGAQLAERSRELQRLGNWDEAMTLIEASLLLQPDDRDALRDAIVVSGRLAVRYFYNTTDRAIALPALRSFHRGGEHIETFLQTTPDLVSDHGTTGRSFIHDYPFHKVSNYKPDAAEIRTVFDEAMQDKEKLLYRLTGLLARQKAEDDWWYLTALTARMPSEKRFEIVLRVVIELQDLPNARARTKKYATGWLGIHVLNCPAGEEFIRRLSISQNTQLVAAAQDLKSDLAVYLTSQSRPRPKEKPLSAPAEAASPAEVAFREISLRDESGEFYYSGCHPAGPEVDVVWGSNRICLMKRPGELKTIWTGSDLNDRVMFLASSGAYSGEHVTYDGQYVWAAISRWKAAPSLLVIDPIAEKVWQLTGKDGLPIDPVSETAKEGGRQYLAVTAIAPGKVCVAGTFGRTWIAIVTFRGEERPQVEVFHECLDVPDSRSEEQWKKTTVAFDPTYMLTLKDPKSSEYRIILGRSASGRMYDVHPLVIDPARRTVEVFEETMPYAQKHSVFAVHDGGLYALNNRWNPEFVRFALPKLTRETLLPNSPAGKIYFHHGEFHTVGEKWWIYNPAENKLRLASNNVPWKTYADLQVPAGDAMQFGSIYPSNHFGLLVATSRYDARGRALYQAEFSSPRRDAPAIPTENILPKESPTPRSPVSLVDPPANQPDALPDARAASWVVNMRGRVEVRTQDNRIQKIADLATWVADRADLPSSPFTVERITMSSAAKTVTADFANLKELKELREAGFYNNTMTDERLEYLQELKSIQVLKLVNCSISDAGLIRIQGLTDLKRLDLSYSRITDAGLEHLQSMKSLESVNLTGTKVTKAGVDKLQAKLPNCRVHQVSARPAPTR